MVQPYELTDAQWVRIDRLLRGKPGAPGRAGADNRLCVNAVRWGLRTGPLGVRCRRAKGSGSRGPSGGLGAGVRSPDDGARPSLSQAR